MREPSEAPRLRAGLILLAILLLSLHWSIREDPCAARNPLEIEVVSQRALAVEVRVELVDGEGLTVFRGNYQVGPGGLATTGPIRVAPGDYRATATVTGDGHASETLRVDGCGGSARIEIAEATVTIIRSEEP